MSHFECFMLLKGKVNCVICSALVWKVRSKYVFLFLLVFNGDRLCTLNQSWHFLTFQRK